MTRWPRHLEILLGIWLMTSPAIFPRAFGGPAALVSETALGAAVADAAAASLRRRWQALHWLLAPLALWLALVPYLRFQRPGPPLAQNDIIVGLILLMLFILPTQAADPPQNRRESSGGPGGSGQRAPAPGSRRM